MPDPRSSPAPRSPKPTAGPVRPSRPGATATPANIATPKKVVKPVSKTTAARTTTATSKTTPASKTTPPTAKTPTEGVRLVAVPRPAGTAVPAKQPPVEAPRTTAAVGPRPAVPVRVTPAIAHEAAAVPVAVAPAADHKPAPPKRMLVALGDEVLGEVRLAQRVTLDAMAGWRAAVGKVVPELLTAPFLRDGAEIAESVGAVFDLTDKLLANQRRFVRQLANLVPWA